MSPEIGVFGIRVLLAPGDLPARAGAALAAAGGDRVIQWCASDLGDAGVEVTLYALGDSAEGLARRLREVPGVLSVDAWGGEGDPALAALKERLVAPIPSSALAEMYDELGSMLGAAGAAISYHMALRLGERIMGLLSAVREPRDPGEALSYAAKVVERYGLGRMSYEVLSEEPLRASVRVEQGEVGLSEAVAGMVRGLVAGMLSRSTGKNLAVGGRARGEGYESFELIEGAAALF